MKTEFVPNRIIDRACRKQERKNLKEKGRSLSWVSMLRYAYKFCIEQRGDEDIAVMQVGWRDIIKTL